MTFKLMKQLLTDPVAAINRGKKIAGKKHEHTELLALLITEWLFIGLGLAITLRAFGTTAALGAGAILALAGLVVTFFGGFLVQLVFNILGGKGTYWTGLGVVVYSKFPIAFAILVASVLFMVPTIGIFIGALLIIIMSITSISILYRSIKELFNVDIITAWIGIGILILAVVLAVYLSIILVSPMSPGMLSMLSWGRPF